MEKAIDDILSFISKPHKPLFTPPVLSKVPLPISWFFGYRRSAPKATPYWTKLISVLLVTMAGMLCNLALAERAPLFKNHYHFTTLVPSFAASCVLIYGAIDAPFSQPRNLILGHFLSGLVGVCVMKLFMTTRGNERYLWLAGALSVACASVVMDLTGTIHPPSGATALLPCVNEEIRLLGWNYLPVLLIHCCVFLGVALLCNNIVRQYPKYWLWQNIPPQQIVVTKNGVSCPPDIYLTDDEIRVIQGIQGRIGGK